MHPIRPRIHFLAALVLLVWLFAIGAAAAQDCVTHTATHSDCCHTMQAASVRADPGVGTAVASQPLPDVQPRSTASRALPAKASLSLLPARPPWPAGSRGSPDIPVVFLRLAL